MSELKTIIETVNNQAAGREVSCLSMRAERLLAARVENLEAVLRQLASLNGQPTAQDIARMNLS